MVKEAKLREYMKNIVRELESKSEVKWQELKPRVR